MTEGGGAREVLGLHRPLEMAFAPTADSAPGEGTSLLLPSLDRGVPCLPYGEKVGVQAQTTSGARPALPRERGLFVRTPQE